MQYFDLILVDLIGFAGSSRPLDYDAETISPKDSVDYFINFVEKWRKQMKYIIYKWKGNELPETLTEKNKIPEFKNFILAGHSFGGYVSGSYAAKYPKNIKKLILISSIGLRLPDENKKFSDIDKEHNKDADSHPKWFAMVGKFCWVNRLTPFRLGRYLGPRNAK